MKATFEDDGRTVHLVGELTDGRWKGWRFTVVNGDLGVEAVTINSPAGRSITAAEWRATPIRELLTKGRHMLRTPALVATIAALATEGIAPHKRRKGTFEHETVAKVYRAALRHGASVQEAVGAIFQVDAKRASNAYITPARQAGALKSATEERERHGPERGWWKRGDQVVNRPLTAEEVEVELGPARAAQQAWNDFLSAKYPALLGEFVEQYNQKAER